MLAIFNYGQFTAEIDIPQAKDYIDIVRPQGGLPARVPEVGEEFSTVPLRRLRFYLKRPPALGVQPVYNFSEEA